MADLIIKGMEMAIDCRSCWMRVYCYERGLGIWGYGKGRPCPLVQLPEKHGRLIDADAFEEAFIRYYLEQERSNNLVFAAVEIKQHLADMIGDWPTIVPAEGGGEE